MKVVTWQWRFLIGLAVVPAWLCASCGGSGHAQPGQTPAPELPSQLQPLPLVDEAGSELELNLVAPSELEKLTSADPPGDANLLRYGTNFFSQLPRQNYSDFPQPFLELTGNWTPSSGPADLAYAGYWFQQVTTYHGEGGIRLFFQTPPVHPEGIYIGMSDFASDTWVWHPYNPSGYTAMPGFANYISSSQNVYVMVLVAAEETVILERLIIGDRLTVWPLLKGDLDEDPALNVAPLTVNWDASISAVIGGEITGYDFDFEDDGSWDVLDAEIGLGLYTYTEPGSHTCRMRATDDVGQTGEDAVTFWAVDPANQAPLADLQASATGGNAPLSVNFDASGSTDDKEIQLYEWDFDDDGIFEISGPEAQRSYTFVRSGFTTVTLRVTDNDFATDTATEGMFVIGGFVVNEIAADVLVNDQMDIALCGIGGAELYPTVAFQESLSQDLKVVKATTEDGTTWGPVIDAAPAGDNTGYSPAIVKGALDRPVVVFGENTGGSNYSLVAAWPGVANLDKYDAWNGPWAIDGANNTGRLNSIHEFGGVFHVASISNFPGGTQSIYYYRSNNNTGNDWQTGVKVMEEITDGGFGDIAIGRSKFNIFSFPLIAFTVSAIGQDQIYGFGAVTTNDVAGETWHDPVLLDTNYYTNRITTVLADDVPLLAAGAVAQSATLYAVRAENESGTSWPATAQEIGERGSDCDMAIVDGKPAVCFMNPTYDLQYVTAANAQGTDWADPVYVDSVGMVGSECAMTVIGGTSPIIVYYDETNDSVKVASWL